MSAGRHRGVPVSATIVTAGDQSRRPGLKNLTNAAVEGVVGSASAGPTMHQPVRQSIKSSTGIVGSADMTDWPVLAGLPAAERDRILRTGRRCRFARGETLFHHGDPADALYLLASGRVAVRVATPHGDQTILSVLGPGQAFGELALLGYDPHRTATVTALEPSETIALHRTQFDALRARYPTVDRFLLAALSAQVARLSAHLLEVLFVPSRARILRRVLALSDEFENGVVRLTQEDIALMSGTTRSTVNEVLREAERDGVVRIGRGHVDVLDRKKLAYRAQ